MEVIDRGPVHISTLFARYDVARKVKPTSERAELMRYFFENAIKDWGGKTPLKPGYVGMRLAHLTMFDLHAFKSQCEDARRRQYPWSKYFWGSLKVKS